MFVLVVDFSLSYLMNIFSVKTMVSGTRNKLNGK